MEKPTEFPPHVREAIHEVADAIVNDGGYADTAEESDMRAERRDALEGVILNAVRSWMN